MLKYEVSDKNFITIQKWLDDVVYPTVITEQKEAIPNPSEFIIHCWERGVPWEGTSGGGLDYIFSPTNLGVVFRVKYGKHVLDLTDYGEW